MKRCQDTIMKKIKKRKKLMRSKNDGARVRKVIEEVVKLEDSIEDRS